MHEMNFLQFKFYIVWTNKMHLELSKTGSLILDDPAYNMTAMESKSEEKKKNMKTM